MSIRIEINGRGQEEIVSENLRGQKHVILTDKIFCCGSNGQYFIAPSIQHNLSRLNPHEVKMIEFWLAQKGTGIEPDVFAGEPSSG